MRKILQQNELPESVKCCYFFRSMQIRKLYFISNKRIAI